MSIPPRARALLAEMIRRRRAQERAAKDDSARVARLRALAFGEQLAFIDDPSRKKAARCTRRAGKTAMAAIYLLCVALSSPDQTCLYLALTRASAKRLVWRWLKELVKRAGLNLPKRAFNESELTVNLPNGSVIYIGGADATEEQREKLLGGDFSLVIIDEAASFRTDLRALVYETLDASTVDRDGTICLIGTPGDFIGPKENRQLFFGVTHDAKTWPDEKPEGGWSLHTWTTFENPHMAAKWAARVEKIRLERPTFLDSPEYARMYEGRWAIDITRLVYRYRPERNAIVRLPEPIGWPGWSGVIATDLGFNDASAFAVCLWRDDDPDLYVARCYKRAGLDLTDVATEVRALQDVVPQSKLVVDGASKQSVEEMRGRMNLPFVAADKTNKPDFVRHLNTDLATSKIHVVTSECGDLLGEWSTLLWDERAHSPKELASCENHCADAVLYGWRYARNFMFEPKVVEKPKTEDQKVAEFWRRQQDEIEGEDWSDSPF
jgi:hypothetical protein